MPTRKQLVVERAPESRVDLFDASEETSRVVERPHFRLRLGEADLPDVAFSLVVGGSEITSLLVTDGDDRPLSSDMHQEDIDDLREVLTNQGADAFREHMEKLSSEWRLTAFEARDPGWASLYEVRRGGVVDVKKAGDKKPLIDAIQRYLSAK